MKKKYSSPAQIFLAAILFASCLLFTGCRKEDGKNGIQHDSPEAVVQKYLKAGAELDFKTMKSLCNAPAEKEISDIEKKLDSINETIRPDAEKKVKNMLGGCSVISMPPKNTYMKDGKDLCTVRVKKTKDKTVIFYLKRQNNSSPWKIERTE